MERTFNSLRKKITSVVTVVFMMMSMIVIPSTANALFENDPLYGNDNWVFSDGTTLAIGFVNPERSLLSWAVAGANVVAYPANVMTNACDHIMETSGY